MNSSNPKNVGVIIVSGDHNKEGFAKIMKDYPYLAIPFDLNVLQEIHKKHDIHSWPNSNLYNRKTGELIEKNCVHTTTDIESLKKILVDL